MLKNFKKFKSGNYLTVITPEENIDKLEDKEYKKEVNEEK